MMVYLKQKDDLFDKSNLTQRRGKMRCSIRNNRSSLLAAAVFALCVFGASQLYAQTEGQQLPEGKKVFENYLKAIGGKEALAKVKNISVIAEMEIKGVGVKGKITRYGARPDKFYAKVELLGIGTIPRGYDGKVMWEIHPDPSRGPRLITGKEKEMMMHLARFDLADYEKQFKTIECIGQEKVNNEDCYALRFTPLKAAPYTSCYSKKSWLELKKTFTIPSQMGEIEVTQLWSDYKEVNGVKYAFTSLEKSPGSEIMIKTTSVKHNAELPSDCFDLPDEIKKIIDKAAEKK
jgi:zinc protease